MKKRLVLRLRTNLGQHAQLLALQQAFAQVCNELAPIAQQHTCWNRVALHHMAYRSMRAKFPGLGSQMICNAIYSVSRSCRLVYQHPQSPFNLQRLAGRPLPRLYFLPQSPVYFDRHTLSLKDGQASMFTLDGRMRFQLELSAEDEVRFRSEKLREIVLQQQSGAFTLSFLFESGSSGQAVGEAEPADATDAPDSSGNLPEYMLVLSDEGSAPAHSQLPTPQAFGAPAQALP